MLRGAREAERPLSEIVSLAGKRALITGAAAGIGEAVAHRFAEAGAALDLVDIDEEGLKAVRADLAAYRSDVATHRLDLCNHEQIDGLWRRLAGKEPDILVNNAGIYPMKDFLEVDDAFLRKVTDLNQDCVFWMCQGMIRGRGKKGGVIINVASIEAVLPFKADLAHYDMTKAGVIALTRALAKDYGDRFRINALLPGGILTPGTKGVALEVLKGEFGIVREGLQFRSRLPIGRFGRPDEVARMALVLASDLSSYVHGALVAVDGGFLSA